MGAERWAWEPEGEPPASEFQPTAPLSPLTGDPWAPRSRPGFNHACHANWLSSTERYLHLSPTVLEETIELLGNRPAVGPSSGGGQSDGMSSKQGGRKTLSPKGLPP